jgi:hypothetical protein
MHENFTKVPFSELSQHLYIMKRIQVLGDQTTIIDAPIVVHAHTADAISDVTILKASVELPVSVALCPVGQFPSAEDEQKVKTYHVPIQAFAQLNVLSVTATAYAKIGMESQTHYYIAGEHMHGSSGGVVVDVGGRAVGVVCGGYVPGISLPLPNAFNTVWETVSNLSEGVGNYTRCVKFDAVPGFHTFVSLN